MNDIWAGIVTYNPDIERLQENIEAVINQVDGVIVVDNNSTNIGVIESLLKQYDDKDDCKIICVCNDKNYGVAKALNQIMNVATNRCRAKWVLTLDQDTVVYNDIIDIYKKYINSRKYNDKVTSITCNRNDRNYIEKNNSLLDSDSLKNNHQANLKKDNQEEISVNYVKSCITSGNLLSTKCWYELNGFDERLFIDMVDDEFCIRLRNAGYKIAKINKYGYLHELGENVKQVKFLGKNKTVILYSDKRKFYLARNILYITKQYKMSLINEYTRYLFKRMLGTIIYEKGHLFKLKHYLKGISASKKLCTK